MPRNYDEIRDREDLSFVIRGETFKIRRADPTLLDEIVAIEKKLGEIGENTSYESLAKAYEEKLLLLIDDSNGAVARWQELRADKTNPISYGEIVDLNDWALEAATGRPTMQPEPSASGPGKTAGTSKAG